MDNFSIKLMQNNWFVLGNSTTECSTMCVYVLLHELLELTGEISDLIEMMEQV